MGTEILLVEDDSSDAELMLRALRKNSLANRIHLARDGEETPYFLFCRGAHLNRRPGDVPRLVLLDLRLSIIVGLEARQALKSNSRTRPIPIVVRASSREERDLASSYKLGVNSYIQKLLNFAEFRDVVCQLGAHSLFLNRVSSNVAAASTYH